MVFAKADESVGKALLGSVETAIITIRDFRDKAIKLEFPNDKQSSVSTRLVAGQLNIEGIGYNSVEEAHLKRYKVQFNPKELTLNSSQAMTSKGSAEQKEKDTPKNVPIAHSPPKITLLTTLIFDEVNLYDSFMSERLTTGLASMATNAATAVAKHGFGKKWTVQPQVEGLIAALRNPYTRTILFTWNEFMFEGILNQISAEYTMFSVDGHPVRAKVRIRLVNDRTLTTNKAWSEYFKQAFGGDNNSTDLTGLDGKAGNLLNAKALGL
jgi:hypothetical protein